MAIKIRVDAKKMEDLLRNFYLITGIRIVVFDDNFEKIAEYPGNHCGYCKIVRKDPNARALCKISDIKDDKNHFMEYKKIEGRRQFEEADDCVLKVIAVNGKLIFTGKKSVVDVCQKQFSNKSGNWFMDVVNFRKLDEILKKEGYRIKTVHPFFIPKDDHVYEINGVEIKKYNQEEILQFKDDDRFDEAFCFSEASPDVLAVAAIIDNEIVGMAGASADSPSFWQIGINVNKNFEGRHIASGLVSILKSDILKKGIVPYYGTSFSNLASQHVAARAGFEVAWVELITEKNTADDVYTG